MGLEYLIYGGEWRRGCAELGWLEQKLRFAGVREGFGSRQACARLLKAMIANME